MFQNKICWYVSSSPADFIQFGLDPYCFKKNGFRFPLSKLDVMTIDEFLHENRRMYLNTIVFFGGSDHHLGNSSINELFVFIVLISHQSRSSIIVCIASKQIYVAPLFIAISLSQTINVPEISTSYVYCQLILF